MGAYWYEYFPEGHVVALEKVAEAARRVRDQWPADRRPDAAAITLFAALVALDAAPMAETSRCGDRFDALFGEQLCCTRAPHGPGTKQDPHRDDRGAAWWTVRGPSTHETTNGHENGPLGEEHVPHSGPSGATCWGIHGCVGHLSEGPNGGES